MTDTLADADVRVTLDGAAARTALLLATKVAALARDTSLQARCEALGVAIRLQLATAERRAKHRRRQQKYRLQQRAVRAWDAATGSGAAP